MNKIESYIDSVIPKNIPKSKQKILRDELEVHIYDRIDFYTEIGYDHDVSIDKAIADMGEDEETKSSIRSDFEELHFERTWWAVFVGISHFLAYWLYMEFQLAFELNENIRIVSMAIGFILLFAMLSHSVFFYFKGYKKCLIGLFVANISNCFLIFGYGLFGCFTNINDASSTVIGYLIDKNTSFVCMNFDLLWLFHLVVFVPLILSVILKFKGKPHKKHPVILSIFRVLYIGFATVSLVLLPTAETYFSNYYCWFETGYDHITREAGEVYDLVDENTSYDKLVSLMRNKGFMTLAEFEDSLVSYMAKQFRYNYEYFSTFNDKYEIWLCPGEYDPESVFTGMYGIVYIEKGENGKVITIGVGNLQEDVNAFDAYFWNPQAADQWDYFESLNGGESETDVMNFYKTNGEIYGKLKTFDSGSKKTYYRIHFEGYNEENNIELWFNNGILNDGKLHYEYETLEEEHYLYWDYITLAD